MVLGDYLDRTSIFTAKGCKTCRKNFHLDVPDLWTDGFLEPLCVKLKQRHIAFRGGVYTVCIFIIEYATGSLLKKLLGVCPWDYGKRRFSVKGLIRLDYAPAWFVAGLIFESLYHFLVKSGIHESKSSFS
jgi:hypothetical protein